MVILKNKISDLSARLVEEKKHHEDRKLDDADEDNGIQHNFDVNGTRENEIRIAVEDSEDEEEN